MLRLNKDWIYISFIINKSRRNSFSKINDFFYNLTSDYYFAFYFSYHNSFNVMNA